MKKIFALVCILCLLTGCSSAPAKESGSSNTTSGANNTTTTETEATPEPTPEEESNPTFGSTITFDNFEITFADTYEIITLDNEYSDLNGSDVVKVGVHVKNVGEETASMNMFFMKYFGSKGVELDGVYSYFMEDSLEFAGELRSGAEYDSYLHFLYDGDGTYYLDLDNFAEKVEVQFDITK